jgi:hypothetical protein
MLHLTAQIKCARSRVLASDGTCFEHLALLPHNHAYEKLPLMPTNYNVHRGSFMNALAVTVTVCSGAANTANAKANAADALTAAAARVRSSTPALVTLIREAEDRSVTFRGLVETINVSDGIVYVERGDCGDNMRACLVGLTMAGANRIIWAKVAQRKPDWDLMGSVAHELCHAIEVLTGSDVTSTWAMYDFFLREGHRGARGATGTFETDAAIESGNAVRSELQRYRLSTDRIRAGSTSIRRTH